MKNQKLNLIRCAGYALLLSTLNSQLSAAPLGSAFTYHGRLNDGGNPANGSYDLRFTLCDAVTNGNVIGALTNTATGVSNGLFIATLDFGGAFNGSNYWLEIAAQTNGGGAFATLSPRQQILPVPYAIMANTASNLLGTLPAAQLTGTVPLAQLPGAVVTNNQSGVVFNGLTTISNLSVSAGSTNVVAPLTVPPTVPAGFSDRKVQRNPLCRVK